MRRLKEGKFFRGSAYVELGSGEEMRQLAARKGIVLNGVRATHGTQVSATSCHCSPSLSPVPLPVTVPPPCHCSPSLSL